MGGMPKDILYVGIRGHVVALDRATGTERWRAKLSGADFVHVVSDGARLYASTKGRVYAVDPGTGSVLWENGLKGLGLGLASLVAGAGAAGSDDLALDEAWRRAQRQQAAAAAAG